MPFDPIQQYQEKTEAPPSSILATVPQFESSFHQPWSEPVRVRIAPKLAIALIASGLFAPVLEPNSQITQNYESRWHQGWSEPVRVKPRLHAALNPFATTFFDILPRPNNQIQGWFKPFNEPVWPKRGIGAWLQQSSAQHLPPIKPPSVFATLRVTEVNSDVAQFWVNATDVIPTPYVFVAGANVTVVDVPAIDGGAASIKET